MLFWHDHWCKVGVLAQILPLADTSMDPVHIYISAGCWNSAALYQVLPVWVVEEVMKTSINVGDDSMMWDLENSASFSCWDAWQLGRARAPMQKFLGRVWNASSPPSTSFFMWKLLKGFIHVDVKLQDLGITLASKCYCCANVENLVHLFISSPIAAAVWAHFRGWFGCTGYVPGSIWEAWRGWSGRRGKGNIRSITAMCIFKQIWMARNKAKHENISMNHKVIIGTVERRVITLVKAGMIKKKNCKGDEEILIALGWRQELRAGWKERIFRWISPPSGWVKLNTDGCSKGNPGSSAGGGLLRDHMGRLIFAFAKFLGINSSFMAELVALKVGLSLCRELRVERIWIEVDSQSLCRCINSGRSPNWNAYNVLADIRSMLGKMRWRCSHIWREGNCAADLLANLAIDPGSWLIWEGVTPISRLNGMMMLDRLGLEYIRVK